MSNKNSIELFFHEDVIKLYLDLLSAWRQNMKSDPRKRKKSKPISNINFHQIMSFKFGSLPAQFSSSDRISSSFTD